jgi:hypothetical protein
LEPGQAGEKEIKMSKYDYPDVLVIGVNAAHVRVPRLQKSVPAEFGEMLSREIARGEWVLDGATPVNSVGQGVEDYLDHLISTRPHWEIPATVIDDQDDTWESGSLEKQGERWKALRKFHPTDAATTKAMAAEAALYGAKFGSTQKGVKPGTKKPDDNDGAPLPHRNPWHPNFPGTPEDRLAAQTSILTMKNGGGSKAARDLAFAAGVTISGQPLKR